MELCRWRVLCHGEIMSLLGPAALYILRTTFTTWSRPMWTSHCGYLSITLTWSMRLCIHDGRDANVKRNSNLREVVLYPTRQWGGEGLIGCGIGYVHYAFLSTPYWQHLLVATGFYTVYPVHQHPLLDGLVCQERIGILNLTMWGDRVCKGLSVKAGDWWGLPRRGSWVKPI